MKHNMSINLTKNQVTFVINPKVYDLEALYGACYVFLDRAYIFLDGDSKGKIIVNLKGKEKLNKKELEDLGGEFCNELLNYSLRYKISKNNKKIREYIVGRALVGALGEDQFDNYEESESEEGEEEEIEEWKGDTLGIAVPWEEKFGNDSK